MKVDHLTAVELLQDLVRIPSESGKEDVVAARVAGALMEAGWSPQLSGKNVYAIRGQGGPLLLLNSHTDTVPVGEGWTKPSLGAVEGGKLYGRGANDAKGPLTAMLLGATKAFSGKPFAGRVCLAFTCEEEITGKGLETLIKELPRPDAAVVGEPTGLQPATAQKGLLLLYVTAKGKSAHAAWGGGVNAIEIAARDVTALSKLKLDRIHPVLGATTVAVTQISGGKSHNVIPDRCQLLVDIRTTPAYSACEVVSIVKQAVEGEVEVRSSRLEAVDTDHAQPIVQAALKANPGAKPYGSPTLSDWVFLKGIPTVKVGPGDSKRSHTPDEYIEIAELDEGVNFYERLIRSYFS